MISADGPHALGRIEQIRHLEIVEFLFQLFDGFRSRSFIKYESCEPLAVSPIEQHASVNLNKRREIERGVEDGFWECSALEEIVKGHMRDGPFDRLEEARKRCYEFLL